MPESKNQLQRLQSKLQKHLASANKVAIVGIGAELRADDAAGLCVAAEIETLFAKTPPRISCRVFVGGPVPENVAGVLRTYGPSHILLVDAADVGLAPGEVALIDPEKIEGVTFSTHALPMNVVVAYLAETLNAEVWLIGIQPASLAFAAKMDERVRRGCQELAATIAAALR